MRNRNGQVWIETVLYTLIGIAIIGVVLAIATPKINASKDRIVVEQSIESLTAFDAKIRELLDTSPGNTRSIPSFTMKRGELFIDGETDTLLFVINDLSSPYSEPSIQIQRGPFTILTRERADDIFVTLTLNYSSVVDLRYDEEDINQKFTAAPTPYSFTLRNLGGGERIVIDVVEGSRR